MCRLSWDLHVHPGPSRAPRWGDGERIREAARRAEASGFVWKSHEYHTVGFCRSLPFGPPYALPSASLNPWAGFDDVAAAVDKGTLWIWGPTIDESGAIAWETELPDWWSSLVEYLKGHEAPIVLATGHLASEGRMALATAASALGKQCSVTHSLYVPERELERLAALGCAFEVDAYTLAYPLKGRRRLAVRRVLEVVGRHDSLVYATSDGGQAHTGDPFHFAARVFDGVASEIGSEQLKELTDSAPRRLVGSLLAEIEGVVP